MEPCRTLTSWGPLCDTSPGYKEFATYFDDIETRPDDNALRERLFKTAITDMQLGTRQYARRQIKWVRNKLLPAIYKLWEAEDSESVEDRSVHIYLLDATGES